MHPHSCTRHINTALLCTRCVCRHADCISPYPFPSSMQTLPLTLKRPLLLRLLKLALRVLLACCCLACVNLRAWENPGSTCSTVHNNTSDKILGPWRALPLNYSPPCANGLMLLLLLQANCLFCYHCSHSLGPPKKRAGREIFACTVDFVPEHPLQCPASGDISDAAAWY
jgi:hypothetical protein